MARVIAVAFHEHGQLHHLAADGVDVHLGDWVLYPTDDGDEVARCVWGPQDVRLDEPLPTCPGLASPTQIDAAAAARQRRSEVTELVKKRIAAHGLDMQVLAVDLVEGDAPHVAVYYRTAHRVDFRALVPDLARALASRVDLRQVTGRDPARLVGGVGLCGHQLCCSTFLNEVEPISIRLANQQGHGSNPMAVTGLCGHLMCCLRYESPYYDDFTATAEQIAQQEQDRSADQLGCPLRPVCGKAAGRPAR